MNEDAKRKLADVIERRLVWSLLRSDPEAYVDRRDPTAAKIEGRFNLGEVAAALAGEIVAAGLRVE